MEGSKNQFNITRNADFQENGWYKYNNIDNSVI